MDKLELVFRRWISFFGELKMFFINYFCHTAFCFRQNSCLEKIPLDKIFVTSNKYRRSRCKICEKMNQLSKNLIIIYNKYQNWQHKNVALPTYFSTSFESTIKIYKKYCNSYEREFIICMQLYNYTWNTNKIKQVFFKLNNFQ